MKSTLFVIIISFYGCSDSNKYKADISGSEVEVEINRLEDDIFSVRTVDDYVKLDALDSNFMKLFKRGIMGTETRDGFLPVEESAKGLTEFVTNADMQHLYNTVDSTFADISFLEKELSDAFSYYHYYFPDKKIPKLYTVVTPFRSQVITTPNAIGICLDMYLGEQFTPYQTPMMQFPQFLIHRFRPDYITPNVMKGWMESEYIKPANQHRLIDEMIYQGKILYAMDLLLPDLADSLKIGYQKGKIEWCFNNEAQIWTHLIDQELLYSTAYRTYNGVVSDGPFSKGINVPQDAPPRIAIWAGWQIVRKYMDKKKDISLSLLLDETDTDKILRESGYKPN